jgi:hypothetical protein
VVLVQGSAQETSTIEWLQAAFDAS